MAQEPNYRLYHGGGAYLVGVPARHLTEAEYRAYGPEAIDASGLYGPSASARAAEAAAPPPKPRPSVPPPDGKET